MKTKEELKKDLIAQINALLSQISTCRQEAFDVSTNTTILNLYEDCQRALYRLI